MRKIPAYSIVFVVSFLGIVLFQIGCNKPMEDKVLSKEEMVQRGKYLVEIGGCNDCHSPKMMTDMGPVPDTTRLLSGHPGDHPVTDLDPAMLASKTWILTNMDITAWVGPWGISYTANLTPDPETGLGNWTDELFIKALRSGKHMGVGRPILPPMPWQGISQLTDQDLKNVFAYLQSIKPVHNKVPDPVPPDMLSSVFKKEKTKEHVSKTKDTE
jgi:mono/diheme cytochrome c family protein